MKHIIIDVRESGTSTGRYIDKLIEHLYTLRPLRLHSTKGFGPHLRITLIGKPHRRGYFETIAPRYDFVDTDHKEFTFAEQTGLKEQIERLKPDLVHFPAVQQPVWLDRHATRVVTTMQDLTTLRFRNPDKNPIVYTLKQQVYRWVNHRVARESTLLITPSEFVKNDVIKFCGIDPAKITVTYESADDLPAPAKPVKAVSGKEFIMYVGRPTPHKNLDRLIEAFNILQQQRPALHLALIGKKDRNYERIAHSVAQQGIPHIVFTDFVSDQQLRWLYENCQAYTFPSLSEGFGLPALEAMRHGAAVVSSNASCSPEIYGDAAHYFDPLDVNDMASKISEVLNDNKLKDKLIAKGYEQAATYSWQRMAEQTLDVYRRALSS